MFHLSTPVPLNTYALLNVPYIDVTLFVAHFPTSAFTLVYLKVYLSVVTSDGFH